ncbi:MAG TPA: SRPBCC family protein [Thermoleophilaceae bacterium]
MTRLEGDIEIRRPLEEVFRFVADPRNDPSWCPRVEWCEQREGDGPAAGARYEAMHRPSGYPRKHIRRIEVLEYDPPHRIRWRQEDQIGVFDITYTLEPAGDGTRLLQIDEIEWKLPLAGPFGKRIVGRHIGEQQQDLKRVLEDGRT